MVSSFLFFIAQLLGWVGLFFVVWFGACIAVARFDRHRYPASQALATSTAIKTSPNTKQTSSTSTKQTTTSLTAARAYAKDCKAQEDEVFRLLREFNSEIAPHLFKIGMAGFFAFETFGLTAAGGALMQRRMNTKFEAHTSRVWEQFSKFHDSYASLFKHVQGNPELSKHLCDQAGCLCISPKELRSHISNALSQQRKKSLAFTAMSAQAA